MKKKYAVKRFDGDDRYSWAVFYADEIKGKGPIIMFGEAKPIVSGCSRDEANSRAAELEARG